MFFKKNKKESRLKKVDKIVTWVIIASAIAWIVWYSKKTKKQKTDTKKENFFKKTYKNLWKFLAKCVSTFDKKNK